VTQPPDVQGYFVTGTDTGVGKTLVSAGLLIAAGESGLQTLGIKPVATGCITTGSGTVQVNDDALALQSAATIAVDDARVNPVALEAPIAPHLAAARSGIHIDAGELAAHCRRVYADYAAQFMIVEGAGGWSVPLNEAETMADFCVELGLPIILVVGMKLGCLNHALLTAQAVRAAGLSLAGWVANCMEAEMEELAGNLQSLRSRLAVPALGVIPYLGARAHPQRAAEYLQLDFQAVPGS